MKNKFFKTFMMCIMSVCMAVAWPLTAFAGEYQSGINALSYKNQNNYSMAIPAYDGDITERVNGNNPSFTSAEKTRAKNEVYESYSSLDYLGRAGVCQGSLNTSLMPTYSRGSISSIYPTGWVQAQYDIVSGKYLWNRCHLIGFQLTGVDNLNAKKEYAKLDLITGTRMLNVGTGNTGMVQYENMVAGHIKNNPTHHVLYRVTPIYGSNKLVAYGVLMEGYCATEGDINFNVFCYNVQPGISIDYETGNSKLTDSSGTNQPSDSQEPGQTNTQTKKSITKAKITLNKTTWYYTGGYIKPTVTVKYDASTLTKGTDYTVSYSSNKAVGTGCVTITGIGNYNGTYQYFFNIVKKANPMTAKIKTYSFSKKTLKYKKVLIGKIIHKNEKGTLTFTKISGSKKLTLNKKTGKIYLAKGTKKGTYKIKVKTRAFGNNYYKAKNHYSTLKVIVK